MCAAISIDSRSRKPVHRQIYDAWRDGILHGRFATAMRVPSTRELAETLAVSRSTVTQAYEQLIAEGYLESVRGSGTFVCGELPERLLHVKSKLRGVRACVDVELSRYGANLREDFRYPARRAGWISFAHWSPDLAHFPFAIWRRLMLRRLRKPEPDLFHYADDIQGFEPLRREIAQYVARSRAVSCTPDQIVVVNGSQQAIDLSARILLDMGDEIAFENPGYLGSRRIFAAHGAKLRPVRVDREGIVCRELPKGARTAYVTPSHQFPTGVAMSLQRRLDLLAWARAQRAVIIEDDYDSEYRYSGSPLPSLQGLAPDAPVVYCGSFSKVMFPGLRVGYLVAPRNLAAQFRRAKWLCDRNTPMLEQCALADFLREGHLERHIRRTRRIYAARRTALIDALRRYFGDRANVLGDAAGMHALARIEDRALLERAEHNRVQLRSTEEYYLGPAPADEYIFGFAGLNERAIREGVKRIAAG